MTTSPAPSATASATPTTSPPAGALTCESLIAPATLTAFTANGLTFTPLDEFSAKLHDEGNPAAAFFDAGGILCQVASPSSFHPVEVYGWAPFTESNSAAFRASLVAEGFAESATDAGLQYTLTTDVEGAYFECYFRFGDFGGCAYDIDRLQEIFDRAPSA